MSDQIVKFSFRRTWRMLAGLQDCWEAGQAKRHAQATGLVLGQMVTNPDYAARTLLPVLLRFIAARGPQGVDSLFLSAMSAAGTRNRAVFDEAIALSDEIADQTGKIAAKKGFVIHFVDLGVVAGFEPADLVARKNTGPRFHEIPGVTRSHSGRRPIGDPYVSSLIGVSYPDGIRNVAYADGAGTASQMLPGFGPALRNSLHNHDEYRLPNRGVSHDHAGEVTKYMSIAIMAGAATAVLVKAGMVAGTGSVALGGLIAVGLWEGGSWLVGAVVIGEGQESPPSQPTDAGPPPPAGGVVDDPDEETRMPVPDDVSGGRANPFELLQAALSYGRRLDPLINPTQEELGGGYVAVHIPQPGDIDPLWGYVDSGRPREEDVMAWLAFIQAKYFDSLVNPVRSRT